MLLTSKRNRRWAFVTSLAAPDYILGFMQEHIHIPYSKPKKQDTAMPKKYATSAHPEEGW